MPSTEIAAHPASALIESLTFVHGADLSPDGRLVAWTQLRTEADTDVIGLRLSVAATGEVREIFDDGTTLHPAFSPDGRTLAVLRSAGDDPLQLHLMDVDGDDLGEARVVTDLPQGVGGAPQWSPDGRLLALTIGPEPRDRTVPYRVSRPVPWRDGIGLVDDAVNDLHVLDVTSGSLTRLTDLDSLLSTPQWHADSRRLSVIAGAAPDDWRYGHRLIEVDLDGATQMLADLDDAFGLAVADDVHLISTIGFSWTGTTGNSATNGRLLRRDSDGTLHPISGELDVNGDVIADIPVHFADPNPVVLRHGSDALVRVQDGARLEIHRVAVDGSGTAVVAATSGSVYPLAVRGDRLLYAAGDRLTAPDVRLLDLSTGEDIAVTDTASVNRGILTPVRAVELDVLAADGHPVPACFLAPRDHGDPLPTVLLIHGGPETAFGEALFLDAQLLCEAGLGVLLVNPRGSRGYGHEHMIASRGDWGGVDADDFMAALDVAVERGLADPERLGVAGLSFGGYMTTWFVANSTRFRAAVAENAVTNMTSMLGTSDVGMVLIPAMMDGSITERGEQYWRSSPVANVEQASTPTLMIVGTDDHRCPPEQSMQFYRRLRAAGCAAEMVMLPGASHAASVNGTPIVRRAQNDAMAGWLSAHLLR